MLKISGRCTHGPNPSWTFRVRVRLTWGGLVDSVLEWFSPPLNDHAPVLLQLKQRLPELNHLSEVLHRTCKIKPNQLMYTIYSHESLLSAVHVFFIVFMPKTTEWLFTIADTMLLLTVKVSYKVHVCEKTNKQTLECVSLGLMVITMQALLTMVLR